ncbi:uncharacterized protein LOC5516456 [Nematostella vectensis]|uniref:uncharacterized protein LOC5516456 n=1 Tax=Nematostella vectensis TaxID=45351 RepID=UPI00138FE274|nr:uncharacterized protein LOC5516456 [Nematostella vectensis]
MNIAGYPNNDTRTSSSRLGPNAALLSTYAKEYTGAMGPPAENARVRTSRVYGSDRPDITSTYQAEYVQFPVTRKSTVAYGTSSGYRKNNPHPHNMVAAFQHPNRDYFVWSHYQRLPPVSARGLTEDLWSKDLLRKVCHETTRSIYQQDYHEPPYATDPTRGSTRTRSFASQSLDELSPGLR